MLVHVAHCHHVPVSTGPGAAPTTPLPFPMHTVESTSASCSSGAAGASGAEVNCVAMLKELRPALLRALTRAM
jgi:hypothetical protein